MTRKKTKPPTRPFLYALDDTAHGKPVAYRLAFWGDFGVQVAFHAGGTKALVVYTVGDCVLADRMAIATGTFDELAGQFDFGVRMISAQQGTPDIDTGLVDAADFWAKLEWEPLPLAAQITDADLREAA